jgi:hypothetical protein
MKRITEQQLIEQARRLKVKINEGGFDAPEAPGSLEKATNWLTDLPTKIAPSWMGGTKSKYNDINGTAGYTFEPNWESLLYPGLHGQSVSKERTSGRWRSESGSYAREHDAQQKIEQMALDDMAENDVEPGPNGKDFTPGWHIDNTMHAAALKKKNPALYAKLKQEKDAKHNAPPGGNPPGGNPPGGNPPGGNPPGGNSGSDAQRPPEKAPEGVKDGDYTLPDGRKVTVSHGYVFPRQ